MISTPIMIPAYPDLVKPLIDIPDFEKVPNPIHIPFPKPFVPDTDGDGDDENDEDETTEERISKLIMQNFKVVVGGITMCLVITMIMCCCCCRSKKVLEEEED